MGEAAKKAYDHDEGSLHQQLLTEYLPYVKRIVHRIAIHLPSHLEIDDLVSAGVVGLIEAIEKFDPSRDNKFLTYAVFRIRGAVLSELVEEEGDRDGVVARIGEIIDDPGRGRHESPAGIRDRDVGRWHGSIFGHGRNLRQIKQLSRRKPLAPRGICRAGPGAV